MSGPGLRARFARLDLLLAAHSGLWRPQPYKIERPAWCQSLPALASELLALGDDELAALADDTRALIERCARRVPALAELAALVAVPACEPAALKPVGPHFDWAIPGRKRAQIEAFAGAVGGLESPVLEWCAGKGHLGRLLAMQWGVPVVSVERDAALCAQGAALSDRARVDQAFLALDVHEPQARPLVAGRHAVALHACGDLHRALVAGVAGEAAPSLDLVPCCYHLGAEERFPGLSGAGTLSLSRDDRRLAVTDSVTAAPRLRRLRERGTAWRLGFEALRRAVTGEPEYRPLKPVPESWLKGDFEACCRHLAQREGLALTGAPDWPSLESAGWARAREVARLDLLRFAFRRGIELWLALDCALALEAAGYDVAVREFCPRSLTPRNLLVSARC